MRPWAELLAGARAHRRLRRHRLNMDAAEPPPALPAGTQPADDRRLPPQNLDAEMAVLGAVLLREEAVDACIDMGLGPEDFYKAAHEHLYAALRDMRRTGEPIDPITLTAALKRAGRENVCGVAYLSELQSCVATAENIAHWARLVLDASLRRQIMLAVEGVREAALDEQEAPAQLVARVLGVGEKFARLLREPAAKGKRAALKACGVCGRKPHVGACKRGER